MKVALIIPARFKSTRFPGKPLVQILKIELILRVINACEKAINKKNIYVATDNKKIFNFVKDKGYNCIMTSSKCLTGTDRVAEASKKIYADIYLNVQGDEPLIKEKDIKKIIQFKKSFMNHVVCGYSNIKNYEEAKNKSVPKVVINKFNELVYISRLPIPGSKSQKNIKKNSFLKQVCIYAFNKKELDIFAKNKKKTFYEEKEDIEILRFFDLNKKIKMVKLSSNTVAVDKKSDIKKVEKILLQK